MEELIFKTIQAALTGVSEINETIIYNNNYTDSGRVMSHNYPIVGVEFTNARVTQLMRYTQQYDYVITLHILYQSFDENHIGIFWLKNKVIEAINYLSNSDPTINSGQGWGGELILQSTFGQTDFDQLNDFVLIFKTSASIIDSRYKEEILSDTVTDIKFRVDGDANGDGVYHKVIPQGEAEWISVFIGD